MAARAAFSSHATGQITPSKAMAGALRFLPMKTCQLKINNTKSVGRHIYMKARIWNKPIRERRLKVVMSSASSCDIEPNPLSSSYSIKQFYTSINEKNLNKLREFISNDCYFDDCSFIKPFQGKKEVMEFFGQLIASMGQNVEFKIGHVCEGDDFTTGVTWHLEWNKKQIPFTRGCSFYECSMEDGTKLVIKRAQVVSRVANETRRLSTDFIEDCDFTIRCISNRYRVVPKESTVCATSNTKDLQHGFGTLYKPLSGLVP
ncbi:hypothetical protein HYC85_022841 [Camellia sinensis]|uniref:SnoaL-like domain-containing protein n=1 Tax=Camellia sinensis TaxID=4442 RepID=A0A7J7GCU9_CAMSI|nr:hypothetical protein HYC85_022841 [Camellia sinensis]